jgi:hypothetical protein
MKSLLSQPTVVWRRNAPRRRTPPAFRPALSALEERVQLSSGGVSLPSPVPQVPAQVSTSLPALNQKVLNFLTPRLGMKVGGGECGHLASEALRAAGAEFITSQATIGTGKDYPNPGDYVWGTFVAQASYSNGHVTMTTTKTPIQPGDVIQYNNARFSDGTYALHHTSIVAAVNSQGQPSMVYQQNFNSQRYETLSSLDLTKLTSGFVRIYQPTARSAKPGLYEFSVVNDSPTSQTFTASIGSFSSKTTLGVSATANSYVTEYFTTSAGAPTLKVNNSSVKVVDNGAYRISGSGGTATIAALTP